MIIIKLWGGIGNQLFQFVFGQYLQYKYKQTVYYDDNSYYKNDKLRNSELGFLDTNIKYDNRCSFSRYRGVKNRLLRIAFQLNSHHHYIEENKDKIPESYEDSHLYFFQGYWQDYCYYQWLLDNVRHFSLKIKQMPEELRSIEESILNSSNSVSIHIRRGDFFSPKNIGIYGVCDVKYYEKALAQVSNVINTYELFVFTDDIDWVNNNLHFSMPYTIVPNYNIPQFAYIQLMSECKNQIISNSSFSWWGAVLNENTNGIVICPAKWMLNTNKTIALEKWSKIK